MGQCLDNKFDSWSIIKGLRLSTPNKASQFLKFIFNKPQMGKGPEDKVWEKVIVGSRRRLHHFPSAPVATTVILSHRPHPRLEAKGTVLLTCLVHCDYSA